MTAAYDAVIVGAGPNGLAAALAIAREGGRVLVAEAADEPGGAARSADVTLPGHVHDLGAAIHPLGAASPFLGSLPLQRHGLEWIHPEVPLAHPLDDAPAAVLHRSLDETVESLGPDGPAYRRLVGPLAGDWDRLVTVVLDRVLRVPRHPVTTVRFGLRAMRSATGLARRFGSPAARALVAGNASHAIARLDRPFTGAVALVLMAAGHAAGWPMARGGSATIIRAMTSLLAEWGGEIRTGLRVTALEDLPPARAVLFDTSPAAMAAIAGDMPARRRRAARRYRHGPGVFKVDWALTGPIPWTDPQVGRAGTVHLGGTIEQIARAEAQVMAGGHPERPFVLLAQQSPFDSTRAPQGRHTAWAYCHVPAGSDLDQTGAIERQVERFAPGFNGLIAARHVMSPADLEEMNPNLVGGDVGAGRFGIRNLVARPALALDPYRAGRTDRYLCSASTPPGAGVHGMCGYHAARSALRNSLG